MLQDYLRLVAEAHNHLAEEAPSLAVTAQQLRHRGIEGPVALKSNKNDLTRRSILGSDGMMTN